MIENLTLLEGWPLVRVIRNTIIQVCSPKLWPYRRVGLGESGQEWPHIKLSSILIEKFKGIYISIYVYTLTVPILLII